jgi:curved DNA-binding protein CbpA
VQVTPPMSDQRTVDYYELLQISPNAEPDTVHRVYRLLARRWHPDNLRTGDAGRFRDLHEAYLVLSDPEKRAQYDVALQNQPRVRWQVVTTTDDRADTDFEMEQIARLTVLEALYIHRRTEPNNPGIFVLDLEALTGRPREHLEFTIWYLSQKQYIQRGDNSRLMITAAGVDYLEVNHQANLQRRRLTASSIAA